MKSGSFSDAVPTKVPTIRISRLASISTVRNGLTPGWKRGVRQSGPQLFVANQGIGVGVSVALRRPGKDCEHAVERRDHLVVGDIRPYLNPGDYGKIFLRLRPLVFSPILPA